MRVVLSFDNGPTPGITEKVLDDLGARGIRAYFFVLGKNVEGPAGRALVSRVLREGHLVGNHSFSHETPLGDDPRVDAVEREIVATDALLAPLVAETRAPRLFRPFGGGGILGPHLLSSAAARYLLAERFSCVLWNCVPRDWDDPEGWVPRALEACTEDAHVVMVLHDIPGACAELLPTFLDEAKKRGAEFVLDLPESCLPIDDGMARAELSALVRA